MSQDGKVGQFLSAEQLNVVKQIFIRLSCNPSGLENKKCSAKGQHGIYENMYKVNAFNNLLFFVPVPDGAIVSFDNNSYSLNGATVTRKHNKEYFIPAKPKPESLLRADQRSLVPETYNRTAITVLRPIRRLEKRDDRLDACIPAPASTAIDGVPTYVSGRLPLPADAYTTQSTIITNADLERTISMILPGAQALLQRAEENSELQLIVAPTGNAVMPLEITRGPLLITHPCAQQPAVPALQDAPKLLLLGPSASPANQDAIASVTSIVAATAKNENPTQPAQAGIFQRLGKAGLAGIAALGLGAIGGAAAWLWQRQGQPIAAESNGHRSESRASDTHSIRAPGK